MGDTPLVMLGMTAGIRSIEDDIERAVSVDSQVLLTGEHGVGKTLVARLIHHRSPRAGGPLLMATCAAPSPAIEARLFGRITTDPGNARDDARGLLVAADGGTLFIDDVGEMSLRTQGMLFRFLETGEFPRVGSDRRPDRRRPLLDVRLITASHCSLLESGDDRAFREDLYYRLNVVHIKVPPLRERREDIPVLMHHFLRLFAHTHQRPTRELTGEAVRALIAYSWPGNVRELGDVAEQLVLQGEGRVDIEAIPSPITRAGRTSERTAGKPAPASPRPAYEEVFGRVLEGSETFWSGVYEPFMARDLTRTDVRAIVRLGLVCSGGQFRMFAECLRVAPRDYKRFVAFLRKCQCELPHPPLKMAPAGFRPRSISRRATA